MALHVFGDSFKDELIVRGGRSVARNDDGRHPLYRRTPNHTPLKVTNQAAFDRFLQSCHEEAERKARAEDAREKEAAIREGRPFRPRAERERLRKEREQQEKAEQERRKRNGEAGGGASFRKTYDAAVDYYGVLGIDQHASLKEIKRAFRKMALKNHPDKQRDKSDAQVAEAEVLFKQAQDAYDILADEGVREDYDKARDRSKYGKNSPMNSPEFAAKVARMRAEARRERELRMNVKAAAIRVSIAVSLEEAYAGCHKEIRYKRKRASGEDEGVTKVVEIRRGVRGDTVIRLENEGHRPKEGQNGDVLCTVAEAEHPAFKRYGAKGLMLRDEHSPKFERGDVLCVVSVTCIDGSSATLVASYAHLMLQEGGEDLLTIERKGMPDPRAPWFDPEGDLWIRVHVPQAKFTFTMSDSVFNPNPVYLAGDERDRYQGLVLAAHVSAKHGRGLRSGVIKGACLFFGATPSDGAKAFMAGMRGCVGRVEWTTIRMDCNAQNLLDDEWEAVESATVVIVDEGAQLTPIAAIRIDAIDDSECEADGTRETQTLSPLPVLSMGTGDYGELGLGKVQRTDHFQSMQAAMEVGAHAVDIAAGGQHSAVVYDDGNVMMCGNGKYGQTSQPECNENVTLAAIVWDPFIVQPKVRAVACGGHHTLLLGDQGDVWSFGRGKCGQLGHGDVHDLSDPQPIWPTESKGASGNPGARATKICAGGSHSLLLDANGDIWCWGANDFGQLGLSDRENRLSPRKVLIAGLTDAAYQGMAAGQLVSGFITHDGRVFTCGNNQSHLLGHESAQVDVLTPREVTPLPGVVQLEFGSHIAVVKSSDGQVFCWGGNGMRDASSVHGGSRLRAFRVVHDKVIVRLGAPTTSAPIAGVKYRGDVVEALAVHHGWIQISSRGLPGLKTFRGKSFWMLIDGTSLGLGTLLEEVGAGRLGDDQDLVRPLFHANELKSHDVQNIALQGDCLLVSCRDNSLWRVDMDITPEGIVDISAISPLRVTCDGLNRVAITKLASSISHTLALCERCSDDGAGTSVSDVHADALCEVLSSEDLEDVLEGRAQHFRKLDLFRTMYDKFRAGSTILVGFGGMCSLLGVNLGNTSDGMECTMAVIPHVVRTITPAWSDCARIDRASLHVYHNLVQRDGPYDDVLGACFLSESALAWTPTKGSVDVLAPASKTSRQRIAKDLVSHYEVAHISQEDLGGASLHEGWFHRLSARSLKHAQNRAEATAAIREECGANLKMIRELEYEAMGEIHESQRTNFDVFGVERGACRATGCKSYRQPLHKGIAGGGSYVFLCAACGYAAAEHVEITH